MRPLAWQSTTGIQTYITVPKTLNRYGYCDNNPLMFVDNNGLEKITISGGVYDERKVKGKNNYYYEFIDASFLNTAFSDDIKSNFYSCNLGTEMEESFAQYWVNHVGGVTTAYSGRSDYACCPDRTIIGRLYRNYIECMVAISSLIYKV